MWIDCEMTGLNHQTDNIIELSCFLTNSKLDLLEPEGFSRVIHCPKEKLDQMDEWCTKTHTNSGLVDKVLASRHTAESVQEELLKYIKRFAEPKKGVLAGNSVHVDKLFLMREFPEVNDYLHYRIVDVSSLKEIGIRHNPQLVRQHPPKKMKHTAREDILESIDELRWYYNNYLIPPKTE